ncbi:zinc finger protein 675-like isoform X2 [Cylas formicarius]|uniref:zinc finger protein 675-like isoform X2 n=1 Tax=Cylas formicarius TaxID=197179 RepID=UPI002958CAF3|nr:zinc finger protein 675-like isoform X2 [Cylas formicarius]
MELMLKVKDDFLKLSNICRACLEKSPKMKSLLENNSEVTNLLTKFAAVSNLEIEFNVSCAPYLCLVCEDKINRAYEFQVMCKQSYKFIENLVNGNSNCTNLDADSSADHITNLESSEGILPWPNLSEKIATDVSAEDSLENETKLANKKSLSNEQVKLAIENAKVNLWCHKNCCLCNFSATDSKYLPIHFSREHRAHEDNWCSICNKIVCNLQLHYTEHYDTFRCVLCNDVPLGPQNLLKHLQDHLNKWGNTYLDQRSLKDHLKRHYICGKCNNQFHNFNDFNDHECPLEKDRIGPVEISKKNNANQQMRLSQYSVDEVDRALNQIRETFNKHVTCICCNFIATNSRSLSVHMTRIHRELKDLWCSSCNQFVNDLLEHGRQEHSEDLRCPFCLKIMSNMSHLMEHVASHSERIHKCFICQKSFISARNLKKHKEIHDKDKSFRCKVCHRNFTESKALMTHLKDHVKCETCEMVFENSELFCKHSCRGEKIEIESGNKEAQNFCRQCNKKVRSLAAHVNRIHTKSERGAEFKHLCPHCGKQFRTVSKLNVHIRVHTNEAPYKCQYCDRRVKTRNVLVVHERTHTGEKPYICSVCGKGFSQSTILNTHLRIHTGRPEKCTICDKRFCRAAELKLHMRKHTGEKPYSCNHCGQSFKQKSHLVEHTRIHSEDRPYKCEYCKKAFKNLGTLRTHVQIHLGQKPYKCSQCPYACRQPYSLTQHMLLHDDDKPQPDNPYICSICRRSYITVAHFTAHFIKYHSESSGRTIKEVMEKGENNLEAHRQSSDDDTVDARSDDSHYVC